MKALIMPLAVLSVVAISGPTAMASERLIEGRQAYQLMCAQCHETGIAGVPQTRNTADWADRSHLWEGVLFEHAEKGYLQMPARGGNESASDYDVEAAAEYMLTVTYPDMTHD